MNKLQVNIFTNDLTWVGMVEEVESLIHRSSWHGILNSELIVNKHAKHADQLKIGRLLIVNNQLDKALIIEDMQINLLEGKWQITCIPLKGLLNYRICHPYDVSSFANSRQSEVMTGIVSKNLVVQTRDPDRCFWNTDRTKNLLSIVPNRLFGDVINFTINFETGLIGDTLTTVANMYEIEAKYPLGWNIYIKPDFSGYEFNVWHGTHKHIDQIENNPVVFSEEFGNIKNASYTYSIKEWRNLLYMPWKEIIEGTSEEDTPLKIAKVTTEEGISLANSFQRKEAVKASNKRTFEEVAAEARAELHKTNIIESFEAEIIDNPNTMTTYKIDWNLGDIVTVQSEALIENTTVSINVMITGIEEIYSEGLYSINAIFGEGKLSFLQLIKNAIK